MPPPTRTYTLLTDPGEAKSRVARLIELEPESMSVVASVIDGLIADPTGYRNPRWWVACDASGTALGAMMHTPPHPLHIAVATPDEARELAHLLADDRYPVPGVGGLRGPAEAFADEWTRLTGAGARVTMEIGRFDLPVPPRLPFEVTGAYRPATRDDAAVVDDWHQQFVDTIDHDGRPAAPLEGPVAAGRVGLWEVAGRPVSMAYASPANGGVTRISGVWTPPDLRGNGYASAVVAALSAERRSAGEACMLFTDLANPTSNAIYEAIGYRRVGGDAVSIKFS
jgi:RimJ/RimL family protein N-acetyltransferase